jgi:hypothetical protein
LTSIRRLVIILGSVAMVLLVAATAYAAIPGSNGVFHGCVGKRTGILRVIDPAAGGKCSTIRGLEETPIQWNQTGPAGPPGTGTVSDLTNTRTATATLTGPQVVMVAASCDAGDIPVNGDFTVDGGPGFGNQAVFISLGTTRETLTGYQVAISRNSAYTGPDPVVVATVRCLNVS